MIWPKSAQMPAAWFEAFKLILTRGSISYLIRGFSVWSSLKMQQATHFLMRARRSPARCCFVLPFRRFSKLVTRWQEMTASLACLLGLQLQFVLQKKFLLVPPFLGWVGGGGLIAKIQYHKHLVMRNSHHFSLCYTACDLDPPPPWPLVWL